MNKETALAVFENYKIRRIYDEQSETSVTFCNRLKLEASDGKKYLTDVANPETLLRERELETGIIRRRKIPQTTGEGMISKIGD